MAILRIGYGWDSHRLAPGRPMVVGGVRLPNDRGPLGHSDGDVVFHALTDAVLGASGFGDIGALFPDTDPRYKDAGSVLFLREALALARRKGYDVVNADVTVILEAPRLHPYRDPIRLSISAAMGIESDRVNFKAKTAEGLGPVGAGEAMEAHAVVLLER